MHHVPATLPDGHCCNRTGVLDVCFQSGVHEVVSHILSMIHWLLREDNNRLEKEACQQ
jgi:hypothetical protein